MEFYNASLGNKVKDMNFKILDLSLKIDKKEYLSKKNISLKRRIKLFFKDAFFITLEELTCILIFFIHIDV